MALTEDAKKWLTAQFSDQVMFDEPMSRHTSLRVGGPADAYVAPQSLEALQSLTQWMHAKAIEYLVVGGGSNLLVPDSGIRGIVVALTKGLNDIAIKDKYANHVIVKAMAGARMKSLCAFAIKHGLKGINFALGIPGTVGGGIMMNAGTHHGSVTDVIETVTVLRPSGRIEDVPKEAIACAYRHIQIESNEPTDVPPILLSAILRLQQEDVVSLRKEARTILRDRRQSQPFGALSAGCFFKNPTASPSAGELIERAGLKGKTIGGAKVSPCHANFIINTGQATAADILALMESVQAEVLAQFNIHLEPEVKIIGT